MRSERGQATVEWVGIVLLVALALAALSHFAPRANGKGVGRAVLHSVATPARQRDLTPPTASNDRGFPIPPLIPRPGASNPRVGVPIRRASELSAAVRIRLPRARTLLRTARAGAGQAWRRAWIACLVYERFRYALLHPESRFPGHTIPPSEVLRMVNDCISPLDLVRDWPELTR